MAVEEFKKTNTISFKAKINPDDTSFNPEMKVVGTLYFENPMRFEGNVEDSAKVFFDYIVKAFPSYAKRTFENANTKS